MGGSEWTIELMSELELRHEALSQVLVGTFFC
jgi:hypothetical protein